MNYFSSRKITQGGKGVRYLFRRATRAASWARLATYAEELSGAGTLFSVFVAEGVGLNAEIKAAREGTCGL
jgi:hypothetical protein